MFELRCAKINNYVIYFAPRLECPDYQDCEFPGSSRGSSLEGIVSRLQFANLADIMYDFKMFIRNGTPKRTVKSFNRLLEGYCKLMYILYTLCAVYPNKSIPFTMELGRAMQSSSTVSEGVGQFYLNKLRQGTAKIIPDLSKLLRVIKRSQARELWFILDRNNYLNPCRDMLEIVESDIEMIASCVHKLWHLASENAHLSIDKDCTPIESAIIILDD